MTDSYSIRNDEKTEFKIMDISKPIEIRSKDFDCILPDYLIFETKKEYTLEEFKSTVKDYQLCFNAQQYCLFGMNVESILLFEEMIMLNSKKFKIKIPFDWTIGKYYSLLTPFSGPIISLYNQIDGINTFIVINCTTLSYDERRAISSRVKETIIKQITTCYFRNPDSYHFNIPRINPGMFIQGNVKAIKSIKFYYKETGEQICLYSEILELHMKKINDDLYYLPLDTKKSFKESLQHEPMHVRLSICSSEEIKVTLLECRQMTIANGMIYMSQQDTLLS